MHDLIAGMASFLASKRPYGETERVAIGTVAWLTDRKLVETLLRFGS
jgi:hypothetical protein